MRDMLKAVSPVIATLLIILIVVASSVIVYLWVSGYAGSLTSASTEQTFREAIKIEAIKTIETDEGTLIILWVRNIGDTTVKVNSAYYGTTQGYKQANLAYTTSSPPIWGGDVWAFNRESQTIEKTRNGLIFYEDFRNGYNENEWDTISTLEPWQGESGNIGLDPVNGLVLTISRSLTLGTEKYGIRLRNPLSISDDVFVAEFITRKLSGIYNNYLAETYFSQFSTTGNPHYLDQFVAMYINGWFPPITYSTATIEKRDENGYEWDYGFSDYEEEGLWIAVFDKNNDKVYIYYYGGNYSGYVNYLRNFSDEMYTSPYIYLDIGIWSGESGIFSVCFPWIKIYGDLAFIVNNLNEGWRVLLVNDSNILGDKTVPAGGDGVSFNRTTDNIVYPLEAHIVIIPTADDASEIGYIIKPGEVRSIALFITEPLLESFSVKVVTENGVEAVFNVKR